MIKGIYEEYKVASEGSVETGDFVKFLTDYSESNEVNDTAIDLSHTDAKVISAVKLDEGRIFIAYKYSGGLYSVVCTINNNTITKGQNTLLSSVNYSGTAISAVALNENKVFIAHPVNEGYYLHGVVCTISGTTISVGQDIPISVSGNMAVMNTGQVISAVKLDEGKVFIAHSYGSNNYLYGIVCTINGTSISKGTDTQLSSATGTGNMISAVVLSDSKVFIAHSYGSGYMLYGIVCNINGTTITKGTDTQISNVINSGSIISAVKLNKNKVVITHSDGSSFVLLITLVSINDTTLKKEVNLDLGLKTNTGKVISAVALSENKVQITHGESNNYLHSMLCDVNGTTITKGNDTQLSSTTNSGSTISAVALNENKVFIGHSFGTNNYLYGMILGYLANLAKTITSSTEKIGGVAVTSGQAGQMVGIKRPNVN